MTSRRRNLVTGLVVIGAMSTLVWMVLTFSGRAMGFLKSKGMPVVFVADRADGLSDGSPVYYAGVEVGKVTAVHLQSDRVHVRIDGEINADAPLPRNLDGEIKSQSSLGTSTQISLRRVGEPDGPLHPGSEIKIRYTGASLFPPEFTDFVEQANRQDLVKHVDEAIVSLRKQAEKVGSVMDSTQSLISDPKLQDDLRVTLANIRQVTERANKIGAKLETLTDNANTTLSDVRTTVGDANKVIAKTDKNVDQLARQVGDNLDKLGQTFKQFQEISEKINKGHGTAGALINDPKLYDEMAATAKELNTVAASLERLTDQWEHEGVYLNLGKK